MSRTVSLYVQDILENMKKAEAFVSGMTYEDFSRDEKTTYAVVRCLEVIGEASKNIPQSIRRKYPHIPWKQMAGMRDKIIHFYFGVKFKTVWLTIQDDLPRLKPLIEKFFEDMKGQ